MSDPNITASQDIVTRLAVYPRTYGPLPSLALHPETPGYTHGMLIRDAKDAAAEIDRLRAEVADLKGELRTLNEGAAHNAAIDRAETAFWKGQAEEMTDE